MGDLQQINTGKVKKEPSVCGNQDMIFTMLMNSSEDCFILWRKRASRKEFAQDSLFSLNFDSQL